MNHWTDEDQHKLDRALEAAAELPAPERGPDYGRHVWARLEPKLAPRRRATVIAWPKWALAASLLLAFWAGWWSRPAPKAPEMTAETRQRLLDAALTDHLDRSQRVLLELVNSPAGGASLDRPGMEDIVAANRLYRMAAQRQGDLRAVAILEDLERLLLEAANAGPGEAAWVKRRVSDTELLFRVRTVRDRVKTSLPSGAF